MLNITYYDGIKYHRTDFINRDKDFFGNGVVQLTHFPYTLPTPNTMDINIGTGVAWVDGYRIENDALLILTVPAADATNPRIDIIQIGHDDINSQAVLKIKAGVPGSTPVEPDADPNYVKLYAITVPANATSIAVGNIADKRLLVPINADASQMRLGGTSATEILNKLLTVDGQGSGLDADMLDGKDSSQFAPTNHTHSNATQSTDGFMSSNDKTKLDGVETGANNYVHPTGDGNQHVPVTGTTNNKKVLKAGATAGSAAWGDVDYADVINKPSTFTPSPHSHPISDVTNLQTSLDSKANASDLIAHQADEMKHIDYAVASGTNTYTATITNITALTEGLSVKIKFTNANTAASTLNINSLGAKSIKKGNGNDLASGNIKAGQIVHLVYTGTVFQLLGEGGEYGTATAGDVRSTKTFGDETGVHQGTLDLINLISSNIKNGITIDGVTGNITIASLGGKQLFTATDNGSYSGYTLNFTCGFPPMFIGVDGYASGNCIALYFLAPSGRYVSLSQNSGAISIGSVTSTGFSVTLNNATMRTVYAVG